MLNNLSRSALCLAGVCALLLTPSHAGAVPLGAFWVEIPVVDSPDDPVVTGSLTILDGIGQADWEAVWMADGYLGLGGDPEYKFVVLNVSSPELTVRR